MTVWADEYAGHALWTVVAQVQQQVGAVPAPTDPVERDEVGRLEWLLAQFGEHQGTTLQQAYSLGMLTAAQSELESGVREPVSQYVADPVANRHFLTQAARIGVDGVIDKMSNWPRLEGAGQARATGRATAKAVTTLNELVTATTSKVTGLQGEVKTLEDSWTAAKADLAAQQVTLEETQRSAIAAAGEEAIASVKKTAADTAGEADAILEAIKKSEADISEVARRAGMTAAAYSREVVANSFSRLARRSATAGWFWDITGILVGAYAVSELTKYFNDPAKIADAEAAAVALRVGVTVATTVVAGYALHIGRTYHSTKRAATRADLRLRTIHTFLATQDQTKKDEMVYKLAEKLYIEGEMLEEPIAGRASRRARPSRSLEFKATQEDGDPPTPGVA